MGAVCLDAEAADVSVAARMRFGLRICSITLSVTLALVSRINSAGVRIKSVLEDRIRLMMTLGDTLFLTNSMMLSLVRAASVGGAGEDAAASGAAGGIAGGTSAAGGVVATAGAIAA